jgi:hypothetical protein
MPAYRRFKLAVYSKLLKDYVKTQGLGASEKNKKKYYIILQGG